MSYASTHGTRKVHCFVLFCFVLFCFALFYCYLFYFYLIFYCFCLFQGSESGGHASSGTTRPPSFVSVAARGEWSIGKVLNVYFKFGMGGDQYLGHILALLDPNKPEFFGPAHALEGFIPSHHQARSKNVLCSLYQVSRVNQS